MEFIIISVLVVVTLFGLTIIFGAPYVPTRKKWAQKAIDLAQIGPDDLVVDLGSGDGVILKMVAERGGRAIGYEINPILVLVSWLRLRKFHGRVSVKLCNFWRTELPAETSVIYVFIESRDLRKLTKYLRQQRKHLNRKNEIKIVSFGFEIPGLKLAKRSGGMNLYEI